MRAVELSKEIFSDGLKVVSIGGIRQDIVESVSEGFPELSGRISSDMDILFWSDRVKHTEQHRKDFVSDAEYELCFEEIPSIIDDSDYVSIHPNKNSISFIRRYTDNISVAVRLSADEKLAYWTMYPLRESQLENYIKQGKKEPIHIKEQAQNI